MLSSKELHLRAALFAAIRDFFGQHDFLEVDTPIRQKVIIPEKHIEPIVADGQYLQTSPELYMKRLLAAGSDRVFQICKCFRRKEIGHLHLEEFTMLEWYRLDADYNDLMADCQMLLWHIADTLGSMELVSTECCANLQAKKWQKITVAEMFEKYSPVALEQALQQNIFEQILVEHIETRLGFNRPALLSDYPVCLASLARKKSSDSSVAERFELYVRGVELANGFSELTDAAEQEERFTEEIADIRREGNREMHMPLNFLKDLGKMDKAAGIAFGVDRLFMLLLGKTDIRSAVNFGGQTEPAYISGKNA